MANLHWTLILCSDVEFQAAGRLNAANDSTIKEYLAGDEAAVAPGDPHSPEDLQLGQTSRLAPLCGRPPIPPLRFLERAGFAPTCLCQTGQTATEANQKLHATAPTR